MRFQNLADKLPFKVLVPFVYVLFYLSVLLYLFVWPPILLYGYLFVCPLAWAKWGKQGNDVLVVSDDTKESREWCDRIVPSVDGRAVFLDYNSRGDWSLASQLFGIFGPHAIPESFNRFSLPTVIVLKRFHRPKKFIFGSRRTDRELLLQQLRSELSD